MASTTKDAYYIPHKAQWPIVGSIGLSTLLAGFANYLNGATYGSTMMIVGVGILVTMLFGWFGTVIAESESGIFNGQVDVSFRMGMVWFIFSEVMFFAAFFSSLYYTRVLSESWLAGGANFSLGATKELLGRVHGCLAEQRARACGRTRWKVSNRWVPGACPP